MLVEVRVSDRRGRVCGKCEWEILGGMLVVREGLEANDYHWVCWREKVLAEEYAGLYNEHRIRPVKNASWAFPDPDFDDRMWIPQEYSEVSRDVEVREGDDGWHEVVRTDRRYK